MTTAAQAAAAKAAANAKNDFDYCVLAFDGYRRILVPREAAIQFFRGVLGKELYRIDTWYDSGNSSEIVEAIETNSMPTRSAYSPVQFHLARVAAERKAEKEAKDKLA